MTAELSISRASKGDAADVWRLASRLARTGEEAQAAHAGFLVPYTEDEYARFAEEAGYFFILKLGDRLGGFLLAHAGDRSSRFGGEVYSHIQRSQKGSYLVVRQIGIAPEYAKMGLGRKLYAHLFRSAEEDAAGFSAAFCLIWKRPLNAASEHFHRATGWQQVDTYRLAHEDRVAGIWRHPLPTD